MQREIEQYAHKYNLWKEINRSRNASLLQNLLDNDLNIRGCIIEYNLSHEMIRKIIKEFFHCAIKHSVVPFALEKKEINKAIELKYLPISKRTYNFVQMYDIKTVGDLLKFDLMSTKISKGVYTELKALIRYIKGL